MKDKVVFFTIVDDRYYYPVGTPIFINSFKRFHPDIDLVVFRQDMVDKIFKEKGIDFYCAKPTFAKLLTPYYELVVNIDADTVVTARLDPVLTADYEVGGAWNKNDYEDAAFENITADMYVQAGMVGSRNPKFWDIWEEANKDYKKYIRKENDTLNLVWYNDPTVSKMKRMIWDKEMSGYLGCKSLNREKEFMMRGSELVCRNEPVYAYHWAKGGAFPKLDFSKMGVDDEVRQYLEMCGHYGKSVRYSSL